MAFWIRSNANTRKRVIHLSQILKNSSRTVVLTHGLIEVTTRYKDRRDVTVSELRDDVFEVLLIFDLTRSEVWRQ